MTREEARRMANKTIDDDLRRCCDGLPHGLADAVADALLAANTAGAAEQRKRDAAIARKKAVQCGLGTGGQILLDEVAAAIEREGP